MPLIGGPGGASSLSGLSDPSIGRRTPTSSSNSGPTTPSASISSAFSRASPSVQPSSLPTGASHRPSTPGNQGSGLSRQSPLHLMHQSPHHPSASALSAAAAVAAERQALMRQQSPHMTPPPTSSASSMIVSPLSKMYGQHPSQRPIGSSPPPPPQHHLRPGASPPVIRHPQMPLAIPLGGPVGGMPPMGMHPAQSPYGHHLMHPSLFYPHHHHPFNAYHPYHPAYAGPGFSYMKPPPAGVAMDGSVMSHHQSVTSRCEETPSHVDKQMTISNSQSIQHKIKPPTPKTPQGVNSGSGGGGVGGSGGSGGGSAGGNNGSGSTSSVGPPGPYPSPHQYPPPHPYGDSPLSASKTSHMDALRAHAHSASSGLSNHHPTEPVQVEIDPDPEPEIPSPTHNIPRGPSPEAKPDDTECHRSQSAM